MPLSNSYEEDALVMMYEIYKETDTDGFRKPQSEREWRVVEDTIEEYNKIMDKVSTLSRMQRDKIRRKVMLWELKGLIKFTEKGVEIL